MPSLIPHPTERKILLLAAVATYLVIVLGALLRVFAGETCLDWPLCSGTWVFPAASGAQLEYLHRAASLLAGLLLGWGFSSLHRGPRLARHAMGGALSLLAVEALLSGLLLVTGGTRPWEGMLHMGLALGILALILAALVAVWRGEVSWSRSAPFARLTLRTLGAAFLVYLSGSLVASTGAAAACPGWPLCNGLALPQGGLAWLNTIHRALVLLAAGHVGLLFWQAWRTQRSQAAILVASTAAGVLFFAQALLGARGFPPSLVALHTTTAAAAWAALVLSAALALSSGRTAADEDAEIRIWRGRAARGTAAAFLQLTKPIVAVLLLVTTYAGMVIGAQAWPDWKTTFWTLLGGFLAAGGSGAVNQYIDRYDDHKMQRTRKRPIPSGRLAPAEGLAFGVGIALASFYVMVAFVNMLAALLSLAGIIYYVVLYSLLLKKATVQNIVIGGGAGALPPLVGWAAATGGLTFPSLLLFALVFMWTPPHFWALAIVRRKDYARAGVPMLPVVRGEQETRRQVFLFTLELVALTLLFPVFGLGKALYAVLAAVLGLWLLGAAYRLWKGNGNKTAWKMYRYSNMYLAFLLFALMADRLLF